MEYSIANEIKSQTRVVGNIYAYDFIFLVLYAIGTFFFKSLVNKHLLIPYSIFSNIVKRIESFEKELPVNNYLFTTFCSIVPTN